MATNPPPLCNARTEVSVLLAQVGNPETESRPIDLVVGELRRIARRHLMSKRRNHTLQPTVLVNESYLRLVETRKKSAGE